VPAKGSRKSQLAIIHIDSLARIPWLIHGFSTRSGGSSHVYGSKALNLGFTRHDSRNAVERNRTEFLRKLGVVNDEPPWPLVTLRQIHSDLIHCITQAPDKQLVGDGLITNSPGMLLAIQTADCLPVILVDSKHRAVGIFHAGWRGTVRRIVEKGEGEMCRRFGTQPSDLKAAIGPGIHGCCYEVGSEVRGQFESQFAYAAELFREVKESDPVREKYPLLFLSARPPGHDHGAKIFLDLVEANRRQLMICGVPARNVSASPLCTSCRADLLFSFRAEKGITGRMMGVVGINPAD
jgi:YfiH family protein